MLLKIDLASSFSPDAFAFEKVNDWSVESGAFLVAGVGSPHEYFGSPLGEITSLTKDFIEFPVDAVIVVSVDDASGDEPMQDVVTEAGFFDFVMVNPTACKIPHAPDLGDKMPPVFPLDNFIKHSPEFFMVTVVLRQLPVPIFVGYLSCVTVYIDEA